MTEKEVIDIILPEIKNCRREIDVENSYNRLIRFIWSNPDEVLKINTRWLISICDTIADCDKNPTQRSNAAMISCFTNMVKLWTSSEMMRKAGKPDNEIYSQMISNPIPLWDGMTSFTPHQLKGDMTWNLFKRMNHVLGESPFLKKLFKTVITRIVASDNAMSDLHKIHGHLFKNAF